MISKINVAILCKWISYVFLYFESNSFVLYCLSGYKVRIRKIIVGILCKWNAYVFFYFKWNSHVLYCDAFKEIIPEICLNQFFTFSIILNRILMYRIV